MAPGTSVFVQQGASYCLQYLIEHFIELRAEGEAQKQIEMLEILEKVHFQFVMRTVKNQIDNEFQLDTLKLLIETLGVRIIVSD